MALLGMLVVWLAVACADDTENRQFATDRRTPQPTPTAAAVESLAATPAHSQRHALASPEALVDRRGAPETGYVVVDSTVWAIEQDGIRSIGAESPVDVAASPSGDRVAIVEALSDSYDLVVYRPDGTEEKRFESVFSGGGSATPVAADLTRSVSVSWAPFGGRVLLTNSSGELVDVDLEGDPKRIETDVPLEGLESAHWSPRGDQIAVVLRDSDGYGRLALLDMSEEGPARVNVIAPVGQVAGQKASVDSVGWKPYGDGVIFLQGNIASDGLRNGQLVSWDMASNTTKVMATGGQAGPTGSISQFTVGPDGRAVAYVIEIPGLDSRQFSGLYVRSLATSQHYRVPVAPLTAVTDIRWLGDGMAWLAAPDGSAQEQEAALSVRWIDGHGGQVTIATIGTSQATPVAPPAGSPVAATPGATPIASPGAEASPIATPAS